MSHSPGGVEKFVPPASMEELTPEQEEALEAHLDRVAEEKERALRDPGPPWRDWFLYHGAKPWVLVGLLIVDVWEVAEFLPFTWLGVAVLAPLLAGSAYLEMLLFLYLWYRPSPDTLRRQRRRGPFQPSWTRPVQFGRWTPEAADIREGRLPPVSDGGPSPSEFL